MPRVSSPVTPRDSRGACPLPRPGTSRRYGGVRHRGRADRTSVDNRRVWQTRMPRFAAGGRNAWTASWRSRPSSTPPTPSWRRSPTTCARAWTRSAAPPAPARARTCWRSRPSTTTSRSSSPAPRPPSNRLCFGRVDHADGRVQHIGRIGLRDDDGEPVLLDWRAPNAAGFYQATTVEPMGLVRRRRIISKARTVTHIEDEDLADPTALSTDAAAHAVEAPREGRMGDIIATIAADQDRIVRSPMNQVTVVQGGPGTGQDGRRPAPCRLAAVHLPRPAGQGRRPRDRAVERLPALHRPGPAEPRRDRRRAAHPGAALPGRLHQPPRHARGRGDQGRPRHGARHRQRRPPAHPGARARRHDPDAGRRPGHRDRGRSSPRPVAACPATGPSTPTATRSCVACSTRCPATARDPSARTRATPTSGRPASPTSSTTSEVRRTLNLMWLPTTPETARRPAAVRPGDPRRRCRTASSRATSSARSCGPPTPRGPSTTCPCSTRRPSDWAS